MYLQVNTLQRKKKILIADHRPEQAYRLRCILAQADYEIIGIADTAEKALKIMEGGRPDMALVNIDLEGSPGSAGIILAKILNKKHIGFIYLSNNCDKSIWEVARETYPYGFITIPFKDTDILMTLEIALHRHDFSSAPHLRGEHLLSAAIDGIPVDAINWEAALIKLAKVLQPYIPFDYLQAGFMGNEHAMGLLKRNPGQYDVVDNDNFSKRAEIQRHQLISARMASPNHQFPKIYAGECFSNILRVSSIGRLITDTFGIKSFVAFPVRFENGDIFNFFFYSRKPDSFGSGHLMLLSRLETILARLLTTMQVENKKRPPFTRKNIPPAAIEKIGSLGPIIGSSPKMLDAYHSIRKAAPSEVAVLVLGESGTGKERVAHCIHELSPRSAKPMVIIDCTTIPDNLAESLLFGHEKGAFTGALERRIGKFELAEGGTIFLDEIGELSMGLQTKLLRVLQEKEIERIGGTKPVKVNVRIIAATNRNLEEEVSKGRFRLDLYYRLHVFPIILPALRERHGDIPALVSHLADKFCKNSGSPVPIITERAMDSMSTYDWPGNIRELEHVIQRSILLSEGNPIDEVPLPHLKGSPRMKGAEEYTVKTILENERDYINYILNRCKGKIAGMGGAAEILNIPPSTLHSKMKKLGILSNASDDHATMEGQTKPL